MLVLFGGLPGGKTTIAQDLARQIGASMYMSIRLNKRSRIALLLFHHRLMRQAIGPATPSRETIFASAAPTAKKVDSDVDSGIEKNVDAMLVEHKMNHAVRYDVKNEVVTLKGSVPSQAQRSNLENLAQQVPNVKQVVNELEVENWRIVM